ncbi:MAG: DUF4191 domain-containing protein [Austwickia sp.]|jgi:hypothetical protein|nr:DUF4191 domain-containing protein [Austwickia sp.]MBK8435480.1 DUF4191 domain-containing protein [Austwickia sp.]MBK9100972.1 DUF4191 domain-containing protein [Austwickia sp.]
MARQSSGADADPKPASKRGRIRQRFGQIKQVYEMTRRFDRMIGWWLLGTLVGVTALGVLIGGAFGHPIYGGFVAFPLALLAATFLLSKRAEKAAYGAIEGQPGAAGAALQGLKKGWAYEQQPVAVDSGRSTSMTDAALVFRAVGKPGVVLVAEGPPGRATKLLNNERRKVQRLIPNVPVTVFRVGTGDGENVVTPRELTARMGKLKAQLTKEEITAVNKRLASLTSLRPPVPQGIDPQRIKSMGRQQRR